MRTLAVLLFSFLLGPIGFAATQHAGAMQPEYEKNGRIAMAVMKELYPKEEFYRYRFAGRKQKSEDIAVDSFLFLLKNVGEAERIASVQITYDTKNKVMLSLKISKQLHP